MNQNKSIAFTRQPCPSCKEDGTETGYEVKMDCKICFGTGKLPVLTIAKQIVEKTDCVSSLKRVENETS